MGILSDAGWLEEDVPALHDLILRLLFLENASGFNNTLCAILSRGSATGRETSLVFIEKEEKKIREIRFWRKEYSGERARGFINLGFSCLACIDIVFGYA